MAKILSKCSPSIPWENKPNGCSDPVWRYSKNPIINRNPLKGIARIFNSAVVPYKGKFAGVFRAESRASFPRLRVGYSNDGINWKIEDNDIIFKDSNGNIVNLNYQYDPRVIEIDEVFYVVWCNDFHGPTIRIAKTIDFKNFIILDNGFLPFNRNGVLFPRKVNDSYLMLSRPSDGGHTAFGDIFLSQSYDLEHWGRHRHVMERGGSGWWQNLKIGSGPAPIETDEGWLLLYHGVINNCNGYVYSMGIAVLDLEEPSKVLYRAKDYILTPETNYEEVGFVPNVVFPCATLYDNKGRIAIYYGAADSYVALAFTTVSELLDFAKANNEVVGKDHEIGN